MTDSLFDQYKAALRRGHLAALAGDLDGALQAYVAASALVPERALPIASQGTVLHRLGRWPEAADAFDRALRLAPDDEATLRARAVAQEQRGLRSGASADFERLAFVLDVAGRSAEAAEAARRAADLEPSTTRVTLADRLAAAAAHSAELRPSRPAPTFTPPELDVAAGAAEPPGAWDEPDGAGPTQPERAAPAVAADVDVADPADAAEAVAPAEPVEPEVMSAASAALAAKIAELGTQPAWVDLGERHIGQGLAASPTGGSWPPVDLPSPPPLPIEGPPPDPEALLSEAAALIDAGDTAAARDRMLTAAIVHRAAGRIDAALEVCLQLLTTAPGDPQVHLAIANLQLDRGWTAIAAEKIELLARLTALTGDTQAEADVRGLAADRLRDVSLSQTTAR